MRIHPRYTLLVLLAGLALACGMPQVADSPEARAELADELADLSIELGAYENALNEGAALATESSLDTLKLELGRELTDAEIATVHTIMKDSLAEYFTATVYRDAMAGVFADHYTAQELSESAAFYGSDTGRKLLAVEAESEADLDARVGAALDMHTEAFIDRVDTSLAETFAELAAEGS